MELSEEAKTYWSQHFLHDMAEEENDWLSFPDDFEGDRHPVHRVREAYAFVEGGRYPRGFSDRFTNAEFIEYAHGRCSWQIQGYPQKFCGKPVASPDLNDKCLSAAYCSEHCSDILEHY